MSMRLNLSGFKLVKMRSLFGSGDRAVIAEIGAHLDRVAKEEDDPDGMFNPVFCEEVRRALRQVVEVGVPVPGLTTEGLPYIFLADWLARYKQRHVFTDCDYKYFPVLELFGEFGKLMTPVGRKLFGYLVEGRPLFGKGFRSTELPHGYLTFEEAGQLQSCLEAMAAGELDDEDIQELVSDFAGFLDEIRSKKRDVWASVS